MTFTKTSKYALRILGFMAKDEKALYTAQQLHKELELPERYLRRLLTDLSKYGFIKSIQGRAGGYTFTKEISKIKLIDIIEAVEGLETLHSCVLGYDNCAFDQPCLMHNIWEDAKQKVIQTLRETTLYDLKDKDVKVQ